MQTTITDYSREKIATGLKKARDKYGTKDQARIIFAPNQITDENFKRTCEIYGRLNPDNFDDVVIVEEHREVLEKKLPMPADIMFRTPLGQVPVNDFLRNDLCDEGDDFFIHGEPFADADTRTHQLMMMQALLDDFEALDIKIADENHFIVKELVHVLEEVLASHRTLLIFCCDLPEGHPDEFRQIKTLVADTDKSRLFNYSKSGESHINGAAAFISGILLAEEWGMQFNFPAYSNGLYAYADRQRVML